MTELKTLKDFGRYYDKDRDVFVRTISEKEIKAEAVKWVKSIRHSEGNLSEKYGDAQKEIWIKHFFNITEEDLK